MINTITIPFKFNQEIQIAIDSKIQEGLAHSTQHCHNNY